MGGKKKRLNMRRLLGAIRGQKGDTLIEVLIATAILGIVAVAFLSALVMAYHGVIVADERSMAQSLTRAELERVRDAEYPILNYDRSVAGYVTTVEAEYIDPSTYLPTGTPLGMQMVTVTITRGGNVLLITETNKVNR